MSDSINGITASPVLGKLQFETAVAEYIKLIDSVPSRMAKYHEKSDAENAFYSKFVLNHGSEKIDRFHRELLSELMESFSARVKLIKVPTSILEIFKLEFARIRQILESDKEYVFDWINDRFAKDLGICTFRLIPAGAQLVEIHGFPRSVVFTRLSRILPNLWFYLFQLKGGKPIYTIHTHQGNLSDFNPEGWNRCYVRIGQLLKLNPEIKGMQGGSWFYDPALSIISPRLAYLREVPCQNGAAIFFVGTEDHTSSALSTSASRVEKFKTGEYVPRAFVLAWPRDALITFAQENSHLLSNDSKRIDC